jgi:hypothetical protein
MPQSSTPTDDHGPAVNATPARQGRYGKPVFWVLVVSTVLAAAGMFMAWGWKAPGLARPGSQQTANSPAASSEFHTQTPTPIVPPPGTDHTAPGPNTPPQSR